MIDINNFLMCTPIHHIKEIINNPTDVMEIMTREGHTNASYNHSLIFDTSNLLTEFDDRTKKIYLLMT